MAQLTAIEWLVKDLELEGYDHTIQIVKQMEKEQIQDAYIMGCYDMARKEFNPEQYYNETYGKP